MEKILSHKNDTIRTSLCQLNGDLAQEAVQSFRNITGYMGDRSTTKGAVDHSLKLLNNMLLAPEDLRDEVYCQIIKQTTKNPSVDSNIKGWELLAILAGSFPPGEELKPYVMHHCAAEHGRRHSNPKVRDYAVYVLHRIKKVCRLGPRREIPTPVEIEATRRLLPLNVRVSFLDDRYITLPVDSWSTAKELEGRCAKMLGIKDGTPFALYEVSTEEEERVLEPEERILDLVAYWTRLETDERTRKGKMANIEEFRFVYKVRLFLDVPDDDVAGVHLMYIQATHDVVDARYPCTDNDSITLAALQVQEEHGDYPGPLGPNPLTGKVSKYIAKKYLEEKGEDVLEDSITKLYQKLTGYSKREARLSYLDYVKAWKIYGSAYFFAEPQSNREFPSAVVLAINSKGILVVDPDTKDYLAEYTYNNVVTWGHSQNSFVVVTGNITRRVKVYFRTEQGKEMNSIVRAYVEKLMARSEAGDT
uniref:FERM domain-containing protein n=1 Tax=Pinguiococcus pyrenoidosus TaxID=172671 RepID=A0A7R9UDD6_9STRA